MHTAIMTRQKSTKLDKTRHFAKFHGMTKNLYARGKPSTMVSARRAGRDGRPVMRNQMENSKIDKMYKTQHFAKFHATSKICQIK